VKKLWDWVKKNPWKAIGFPLVVLGILLAWLSSGGKKSLGTVISGTTDDAARDAMKAKDKAIAEYKQEQAKATAEVRAKLNKASKEQLEELKKVQAEEPAKVAEWINKLS
jgi:cell division protein FtsB